MSQRNLGCPLVSALMDGGLLVDAEAEAVLAGDALPAAAATFTLTPSSGSPSTGTQKPTVTTGSSGSSPGGSSAATLAGSVA